MRVLIIVTLLLVQSFSFAKEERNKQNISISSIVLGKTGNFNLIKAPSGSSFVPGKTAADDRIYIVSDNQNDLFVFDRTMKIVERIPLLSKQEKVENTISKSEKLDFEGMTYINIPNKEPLLLIISSHSGEGLYKKREQIFLYYLNSKKIESFQTSFLLEKLKKSLPSSKGLNIEGVFINQDSSNIYLINRGNHSINKIFQFDTQKFLNSLKTKILPSFKEVNIDIPKEDNSIPGLSGSFLIQNPYVLLTASLENSSSNIGDGDEISSKIGLFNNNTMQMETSFIAIKDQSGKILKAKAESLVILESYSINSEEKEYKGFLLCDNDDKGGQYYTITMNIKNNI